MKVDGTLTAEQAVLASNLLSAMRESQVTGLHVDYSGSSDEFNGIEVRRPFGVNRTAEEVAEEIPEDVAAAAEDLTQALIDGHHDGFWNCSGGEGEIRCEILPDGSLEVFLDHGDYFTDRDQSDKTIDPGQDAILDGIMLATRLENPESATASVQFDGYGDSGDVEETDGPADAFLDWCWDYLEGEMPGWEINEGGGATFEFDLKSGVASIKLWNNVEKTEGQPTIRFLVPSTQESKESAT